MDKRTFLKLSLLGTGGLAISPFLSNPAAAIDYSKNPGLTATRFELTELPYSYQSLQPHIDALTMEIHHSRHHNGYVNNLNAALETAGLQESSLERIMQTISRFSTAVRNNGGGHYNHDLFWKIMSPSGGGTPTGNLLNAINSEFDSFDNFKTIFANAAATRFGSGWAWLIVQNGKLKVTSTPNQDNPLMNIVAPDERGTPVLGIDVWEHAYYLNYQNRRGDYISAFWNVVNWNEVSRRFSNALM